MKNRVNFLRVNFLKNFLIITLITVSFLSLFFLIRGMTQPRIHTFESKNYDRISGIKFALLNYQAAENRFPNNSLAHTIPCNQRSWRFLLLPYLDSEQLYREILACAQKTNMTKYDTPFCYRGHGSDSKIFPAFLMISPERHDCLPVIINVAWTDFHWLECGDAKLFDMIHHAPPTLSLYELKNDHVIICENKNDPVWVLASDGEICLLSATATVNDLKKIINKHCHYPPSSDKSSVSDTSSDDTESKNAARQMQPTNSF